MASAVDACLWRGVQVYGHILEVNANSSEEVGYGILTLAFKMKLHYREQGLDGWLVDDLVVILGHDGVGEDGCL